MKIVFASVAAVSAAVAFSVGTATGTRAPNYLRANAPPTRPLAKPPVKHAPRAAKTGPAPTIPISALNAVVDQYCTDCHNDQMMVGNLSLEHFDVAAAPTRLAASEKMIRKLRAEMMPLPGAPRPGGDTLTRARRDDRAGHRQGVEAESGHAHVPAPQSPRVRERDPRPARHRRQRRRLSAARHEERELRQHRRRADAVADAARGVSERRVRGEPHGGRRSERGARRMATYNVVAVHVAASVGPRRRHAVRHARRHRRDAQLPGRRHVSVPHEHLGRHRHAARGHRHLDRRRARRAAPLREGRRSQPRVGRRAARRGLSSRPIRSR